MPRKCCVPGCKSNNKSKGVKTKYVSCYSFPKEQALRDKWLQNISRKDWTPSQYSCVCCKHFEPDCFISEVVYNNSKGEEKRFVYDVTRLKPGSYPTIFNDPPSQKFSRKRRDSKSMDINKWRKVIHQKSSIGLTVKDEISNSSFVENNEENVMIGTNNTTPKPAIEPPVFVDVSGLQQEVDDENETENTIGQEDGIANFGIKKEPFDEDSKTWTTNFMDVKVKEEIIEKEEYVVENSASTVVENSEVDYSRPKRKKVLRGYDIYQEYLKMHNGDLSSAGWTLIEDPNVHYQCEKCRLTLQKGDYFYADTCFCGNKFKRKRFKCELCGSFHSRQNALTNHYYAVHSREERRLLNSSNLNYECGTCGSGFVTKRELSHHIEMNHLAVAQNKCNYCDNVFHKVSDLWKHMLLCHIDLQGKQCKMCGKEVQYSSKALYHVRMYHFGEKRRAKFKCEKCGNYYGSKLHSCKATSV